MLKVCRKGVAEGGEALNPEEDRALRLAFGRFAKPEARAAGAAVVRRYQHLGFGNWFLCDCQEPGYRPPALIPVLETYIRRHTDPPWPQHADWCDFHRDPDEQRAITCSYARPASGPLRLLRGFPSDDEDNEPSPPIPRCYSQRREPLATLLMQLIERAGLNVVPADGKGADLGEQYRRLRAAAHAFELAQSLPVAAYLCTYPPALPAFLDRIAAAPPARFKRTRPHGILVAVASAVGCGQLVLGPSESLPVRGRISVFGEHDGHGRDRPADRAARAPYLAICLAGRPSPDQPVAILRAYIHPCVSGRNLMLVDSNLERRTLDELRRLQSWLRVNQGVRLEIEKPHFDIATEDGTTADPEAAPREPCIPDFILRVDGPAARGARTVLVETMGFADETYRARKRTMHELMERAAGAPVVLHDFHFPEDRAQCARDRRFWLDARWTITGSDQATSVPRRPQTQEQGAHP